MQNISTFFNSRRTFKANNYLNVALKISIKLINNMKVSNKFTNKFYILLLKVILN